MECLFFNATKFDIKWYNIGDLLYILKGSVYYERTG